MTSPYESFGSNDPRRWEQPGGPVAPQPERAAQQAPQWSQTPQWGPAPAPQWGPAPTPEWGPAPGAQPDQTSGSGRAGRQQSRTKRKPKLMIAIAGSAVVVIALVGVLGFAWPGFFNKKVFDGSALASGVTTVLRNSYQIDASNVSCPINQPVRVDTRFPCSVLVNGKPQTVTVTVLSGDGRFAVGRPQ